MRWKALPSACRSTSTTLWGDRAASGLHLRRHSPIWPAGVGRAKFSPTRSDPEGSSRNEFCFGSFRLPPLSHSVLDSGRTALHPWTMSDTAPQPYRVLARKYRPTSRSEEHTSELQSLMRNSYAVFCLKKKTTKHHIASIHNN